MTRARLGAGRRLSGEHGGGCNAIGEEMAQRPLKSVLFYAKPGPTGTLTRKGNLLQVQAKSEMELPRKGRPGGTKA